MSNVLCINERGRIVTESPESWWYTSNVKVTQLMFRRSMGYSLVDNNAKVLHYREMTLMEDYSSLSVICDCVLCANKHKRDERNLKPHYKVWLVEEEDGQCTNLLSVCISEEDAKLVAAHCGFASIIRAVETDNDLLKQVYKAQDKEWGLE